MKYLIVGTGGTGGCIGAYLALAGNDVTFIARGRHLAVMKEHGLMVKTSHRGDFVILPVQACTMEEYADTPDVIFVCVKYYGLADTIPLVRRVAGKNTLVVPILNVFGTGEIMQQELPGITVLDGCIYIFAMIAEPGVIAQPTKNLRVFYGFRDGQDRSLVSVAEKLEVELDRAGIEAHFSKDIRRDALQKFSFVSPMGAAGLYFHATASAFMELGEQQEFFIGLVREISALGKAMGVVFNVDLVAVSMKIMKNLAKDSQTSMQRDVAGGGTSEIDGLVHRVIVLGERYHVPMPFYTKVSAWAKREHIR